MLEFVLIAILAFLASHANRKKCSEVVNQCFKVKIYSQLGACQS